MVANLAWSDPDFEGYDPPVYRDLVALSPGGDVLWRASDSLDATALPGDATLIQVTDREVVAVWNGEWHVLSLDDGRELARQPADELEGLPVDPRTGASPCNEYDQRAISPVADAEHIYTPCRDRLHIRRIDDLTTTTVDWPPTALAIEPAAGVVMAVDRDGITAFSDHRPQRR